MHFDTSNSKATGCDDVPIELLKAGVDEAVKVLTTMCNCVWKKKELSELHEMSRMSEYQQRQKMVL